MARGHCQNDSVSDYALRIGDEDSGPYTERELREKLEEYRAANPGTLFAEVGIWEMKPGGTAGTERSVFDFIPQAPPLSS